MGSHDQRIYTIDATTAESISINKKNFGNYYIFVF